MSSKAADSAKSFARRLIRSFGFDLYRYDPASSESARLMRMLSAHQVNLARDVGANTGQFGSFLRDAGYRGRIVSFEPLSAALFTSEFGGFPEG